MSAAPRQQADPVLADGGAKYSHCTMASCPPSPVLLGPTGPVGVGTDTERGHSGDWLEAVETAPEEETGGAPGRADTVRYEERRTGVSMQSSLWVPMVQSQV